MAMYSSSQHEEHSLYSLPRSLSTSPKKQRLVTFQPLPMVVLAALVVGALVLTNIVGHFLSPKPFQRPQTAVMKTTVHPATTSNTLDTTKAAANLDDDSSQWGTFKEGNPMGGVITDWVSINVKQQLTANTWHFFHLYGNIVNGQVHYITFTCDGTILKRPLLTLELLSHHQTIFC